MAIAQTALPILDNATQYAPDFQQTLEVQGCGTLVREEPKTLQINVGKFCNQACHHCHVDAGPKRTEIMAPEIAERTLRVLAESPFITSVDITGGAPELNPSFAEIIHEARRLETAQRARPHR